MSDVVLELKDVRKSFMLPRGGTIEILNGVDLSVGAGETMAITGKSGSGKSTLLNILGLLDVPTSGTIHVEGTDAGRLNDRQRARLRSAALGFVFQQFHLLDRRSAAGNVAEALVYGSNRDLDERWERAEDALGRVGLAERMHSMPHLLSGGEQQRVAIARALVGRPRIVLADEPTGALDVETGERVLNLLFDLVRDEGVTLILVTHDLDIARRTNRQLALRDGRLMEELP